MTRDELAERLYEKREEALRAQGRRPVSTAWPSLSEDERAPWLDVADEARQALRARGPSTRPPRGRRTAARPA